MSQIPEKLASWPVAFDAQAQKINQIIDALRPLSNIEGRNGIKVTVSDMNIVVEIPSPDENDGGGGSGGGGLPDGYGPEEWTVYDGGVVTTRNFLTDNPD
jgi:hypothetical protein